MARISIQFDEELKERVFMVRGDEGYARSTKTLFEIGNHSDGLTSFDLYVTVNVLRDVGDGQIIIYDNDDPVYLIDNWNSRNNSTTVLLEGLLYGVTHNLYAQYRGNNNSMPSRSEVKSIHVNNENMGESVITIDNTTQFNPQDTTIVKTIVLSNVGGDASWNADQTLKVSYDNNFLGDFTTDSNGEIEVPIPNTGDIGIHTLKVDFAGMTNQYGGLSAKVVNQTICVGYLISFTSTPNMIILGEENIVFEGKVTTVADSPIQGATVGLYESSDYGGTEAPRATGITDVNGKVRITETSDHLHSGIEMSLKVTLDSVTYSSNKITLPLFNPTSLTFEDISTYYNQSASLLAQITPSNVRDVPIRLSGDISDVIRTDSTGKATYALRGLKRGTRTVTAHCGQYSQTATITSYIQKWTPQSLINPNYKLYNGTLYQLNNYIKLQSNNNHIVLGFPEQDLGDFELLIDFTTNANFDFNYVVGDWSDNIMENLSMSISSDFPYASSKNRSWRFRRSNGGNIVYFKDMTEGDSYILSTNSPSNPRMVFVGNSNSFELRITNLYLRGL